MFVNTVLARLRLTSGQQPAEPSAEAPAQTAHLRGPLTMTRQTLLALVIGTCACAAHEVRLYGLGSGFRVRADRAEELRSLMDADDTPEGCTAVRRAIALGNYQDDEVRLLTEKQLYLHRCDERDAPVPDQRVTTAARKPVPLASEASDRAEEVMNVRAWDRDFKIRGSVLPELERLKTEAASRQPRPVERCEKVTRAQAALSLTPDEHAFLDEAKRDACAVARKTEQAYTEPLATEEQVAAMGLVELKAIADSPKQRESVSSAAEARALALIAMCEDSVLLQRFLDAPLPRPPFGVVGGRDLRKATELATRRIEELRREKEEREAEIESEQRRQEAQRQKATDLKSPGHWASQLVALADAENLILGAYFKATSVGAASAARDAEVMLRRSRSDLCSEIERMRAHLSRTQEPEVLGLFEKYATLLRGRDGGRVLRQLITVALAKTPSECKE